MANRQPPNQSPEGAKPGLAFRRGSEPSDNSRPLVVLSPSTLHIVAIPLIILSTLAIGFILIFLKEILVPFVVAMFFVYLLRPLVDLLTRPCASCCHNSCIDTSERLDEDDKITKKSLSKSGTGAAKRGPPPVPRRQPVPTTSSSAFSRAKSSSHGAAARPFWETEELTVTFCRVCTFTRCPRWVAVLIALSVVGGVMSMLVLLIADAVQSLEGDDLRMYRDSAYSIADKTLSWINLLFHVDGSSLLKSFKTQVPVAEMVQKLLMILIDAIGNTFLILLLVLYLLFEQTHHEAGSLRSKIDDQIQRYIGIKTLISAAVGFLVYLVLGPMLKVNLAHIFGVLTFFFNFIPNVGPVIATAFPLPLIILDLRLSTTQKLLAVALPTAIHLIIGNFIEPKVFGRSMELHPVIVLLSLAFWFALWGVVGAILSIPVTAVFRIVLSHIHHPYARVILRFLEGRIALDDVEVVQQIGTAEISPEFTDTEEGGGDEEEGQTVPYITPAQGVVGASRVQLSPLTKHASASGTVPASHPFITTPSPQFSDDGDAFESVPLVVDNAGRRGLGK